MDPLSITLACITLIGTISKVSTTLTTFVRDFRDAPTELNAVSLELQSVYLVLQNLKRDTVGPTTNSTLPSDLKQQILVIIKNCGRVVRDIESCLKKHRQSRRGIGGYWLLGGGKDDMAKYRSSLEAHKSAIGIAVQVVNVSISRDIKKDTGHIPQILKELRMLRARLPDEDRDQRTGRLRTALDDITSHAGSVCGSRTKEGNGEDQEDSAYDSGESDADSLEAVCKWQKVQRTPDHPSTKPGGTPLCIIRLRPRPTVKCRNEPALDFPDIVRPLGRDSGKLRLGRSSRRQTSPDFIGFSTMLISRFQCEIWQERDKWYIRDTRSTGGTFLNGERLSEENERSSARQLLDGDFLRLGSRHASSAPNEMRVEIMVSITYGFLEQ